MGIRRGPSIITDGLVFAVDAANPDSYISGSTIWKDQTVNQNNGTLTNGPTFDSANAGILEFDGVNDYFDLSDITAAGVFTLSFWINPTEFNTNNGSFVMGTKANSGDLIKLTSATEIVFKPGNSASTLTESTNIMVLNQWQNLMFIRDSSDSVTAYRNGSTFGSPVTKTQTLTITAIGLIANFFRYKGKIANVKMYDKNLSTTEVSQNYNALKTRFGL